MYLSNMLNLSLQAENDMMDPTVAKLVEQWNGLHKEGHFSALDIREYWRIQVPEIYSPTVCDGNVFCCSCPVLEKCIIIWLWMLLIIWSLHMNFINYSSSVIMFIINFAMGDIIICEMSSEIQVFQSTDNSVSTTIVRK